MDFWLLSKVERRASGGLYAGNLDFPSPSSQSNDGGHGRNTQADIVRIQTAGNRSGLKLQPFACSMGCSYHPYLRGIQTRCSCSVLSAHHQLRENPLQKSVLLFLTTRCTSRLVRFRRFDCSAGGGRGRRLGSLGGRVRIQTHGIEQCLNDRPW